jgi:hypothetical protein
MSDGERPGVEPHSVQTSFSHKLFWRLAMKKMDSDAVSKAAGEQSKQADFDRNRDGLYGGLPKARDPKADGSAAKAPHPPR